MRHLGRRIRNFANNATTLGAEVASLNNSLRLEICQQLGGGVCVSIFNSAAATGELALLN
jgi:hypothetical protein